MINCGRCSVDARSEEYPGYSLKPHCPPQIRPAILKGLFN